MSLLVKLHHFVLTNSPVWPASLDFEELFSGTAPLSYQHISVDLLVYMFVFICLLSQTHPVRMEITVLSGFLKGLLTLREAGHFLR